MRCGLVGGGVTGKMGFEVSGAQARPSGLLFLLPEDLNVELLATSPAPYLLGLRLLVCCTCGAVGDLFGNLLLAW